MLIYFYVFSNDYIYRQQKLLSQCCWWLRVLLCCNFVRQKHVLRNLSFRSQFFVCKISEWYIFWTLKWWNVWHMCTPVRRRGQGHDATCLRNLFFVQSTTRLNTHGLTFAKKGCFVWRMVRLGINPAFYIQDYYWHTGDIIIHYCCASCLQTNKRWTFF